MSRPHALARLSNIASSSFSTSSRAAAAARSPRDSRTDIFREVLYPNNTFQPKSTSPTGPHHEQVMDRLPVIIPTPEVHETIERAFKLYSRKKRQTKAWALFNKFKAMEEACDELKAITRGKDEGGSYDPRIYAAAVRPPEPFAAPKPRGRKISPLQEWKEARIDGLMPREIWVPVESRGRGWDYEWIRPEDE